MILAVIAGLVLALTPFVADKFFPVPENIVRQAKPEAAANALKRWFNDPEADFLAVQAINKTSADSNTGWFTFSVGRGPVEKYIIGKKLKQKTIDEVILKDTFFNDNPPATWWQPEAINQETYFTGEDQGRTVSLMYNPTSKRGILVTSTIVTGNSSTNTTQVIKK